MRPLERRSILVAFQFLMVIREIGEDRKRAARFIY
jgi:hypothetical protein